MILLAILITRGDRSAQARYYTSQADVTALLPRLASAASCERRLFTLRL